MWVGVRAHVGRGPELPRTGARHDPPHGARRSRSPRSPPVCRDRGVEDESALAALRREHAALHERLESAVARDPLATRVLAEPGDLVLAIRTAVVTDLVAEVAHRYFDQVEIDLADVRASADGEVRAKTFLGRIKLGEWQVEVRVERLRGRLAAGRPRLRFHTDRIDVEVPVRVRPAPGTIGLALRVGLLRGRERCVRRLHGGPGAGGAGAGAAARLSGAVRLRWAAAS